jgi:hypothetical protein
MHAGMPAHARTHARTRRFLWSPRSEICSKQYFSSAYFRLVIYLLLLSSCVVKFVGII